jgi:tRNA (guanine-N7-)-methyltransferase
MTPEFARALANVLPSGGELFCCSDVKALACEMYDVVAANGDFIIDEATYARVGDMDESAVPASLDDVPEHDAAHKFEWEPLPDVKPIHNRRWLRANPYEAFTERDIVCEGKWRPVYRFAVARK